jgi:hypothetical protein
MQILAQSVLLVKKKTSSLIAPYKGKDTDEDTDTNTRYDTDTNTRYNTDTEIISLKGCDLIMIAAVFT